MWEQGRVCLEAEPRIQTPALLFLAARPQITQHLSKRASSPGKRGGPPLSSLGNTEKIGINTDITYQQNVGQRRSTVIAV